MPGEEAMLASVEQAWEGLFGPVQARGGVSFLGTPGVEVLRCGPGPDGIVRYATLGMCRTPMGADAVVDPGRAPRAELVLALRGRADSVLKSLAALASAPAVDGLVLTPDATVDLQQPLWDDAPFTAVLVEAAVGEVALGPGSGGHGTDVPPVQLFAIVPVTATELAYRRIHGATALREAWVQAGTDLAGLTRSRGFDAAGG